MTTKRLHSRRGTSLVMICLMMVFLVGMVAFAVDLGRMYLVRSQLQAAVDSGALAASLQLKTDPDNIDAAQAAAETFIQENRVGFFVTVPEDAISVEVGTWDSSTQTFSLGGSVPDAVRVSGEVTDQPLFFAKILGRSTFGLPRSAIANGGGSSLDVVLTLDLSGSMGDNGRIEALRDAAPAFVDVLDEVGDYDRIGVFGYGALPDSYDPVERDHNGSSYLLAPQSLYPTGSEWVGVLEYGLTSNLTYVRDSVLTSSTLVDNKYNGWTPIGAAIRDSAHYLANNARSGVDRVIVLMSDGHANRPEDDAAGYARQMASYAAENNIKVYTISLGDDADDDLLEDIADLTGAEHFIASGTGSTLTANLTTAFEDVAKAVKKTQLVK